CADLRSVDAIAGDPEADRCGVCDVEHNEFSSQRYALLFLPGSYSVDVPVGFYTEVIGLGASPDATLITGIMHADANHENNHATTLSGELPRDSR
ncbi:MAG: hypothetical protein ACXWC0_31140, partial [Burkholderiales bacterium]